MSKQSSVTLKKKLEDRDREARELVESNTVPTFTRDHFRRYLGRKTGGIDPNMHRQLSAGEKAFLLLLPGESFAEKLYGLFFDIPKCKNCGVCKPVFWNFKKGYREFCSPSCSNSNDDKKIRTEQSFEKRFGKGIKNAQQVEAIKLQTLETKLKKFGHPFYPKSTYYFDNQWFDSSWEVIYYNYLKTRGEIFEYHPTALEYYYEGKKRKYYPDFKLGDQYVEVKGDHLITDRGELRCLKGMDPGRLAAKTKCMRDHKVKIVSLKEIQELKKELLEQDPEFLDRLKEGSICAKGKVNSKSC